MAEFTKRIFNAEEFFGDLFSLGLKAPVLLRAVFAGTVSGALREKVMLSVTGVNDCRYCTFVHSNLARLLGVTDEQVKDILRHETVIEIPKEERAAIEFAQHYAQTKKSPDADKVDALFKAYGEKKAREIILYLDSIYFSNLSGNTFDAFLSRLHGEKAEESKLCFELFLAVILAPILLPQTLIINLQKKR